MPKTDVKSIRVGDTLHLTVPNNRHLNSGVYAAVVTLAAKSRWELQFNCSIELCDDIHVHFRLTIPKNPHRSLTACCFLGDDTFPVKYVHEPNIERRLAASLNALNSERRPYGTT